MLGPWGAQKANQQRHQPNFLSWLYMCAGACLLESYFPLQQFQVGPFFINVMNRDQQEHSGGKCRCSRNIASKKRIPCSIFSSVRYQRTIRNHETNRALMLLVLARFSKDGPHFYPILWLWFRDITLVIHKSSNTGTAEEWQQSSVELLGCCSWGPAACEQIGYIFYSLQKATGHLGQLYGLDDG